MQSNQDKENIMKEMHRHAMRLQKSFRKYEEVEMQIYDINQSQIKASVELEELKMKNEMLKERLQGIHDSYMSCVRKLNSGKKQREEEVREKMQMLTVERDNLKKRLTGYERLNDENNEKMSKLISMIEIEKKKNTALIRKLERASKMKDIPQNLRDKINSILKDRSLDNAQQN